MKKNAMAPLIALMCLLVIAAIGAGGGYLYHQAQRGDTAQASAVAPAQTAAKTAPVSADAPQAQSGTAPADESTIVSGDGKLAAQQSTDVLTPAAVTIIQMPAKVGDEVTRGDVLARVDRDKLTNSLAELKTQLSAMDRNVNQLSGARAETRVDAPAKGRVKKVYAEKGDDVQTVLNRDGALALLSTDGLMKVTITPSAWDNVTPGASVEVRSQSDDWEGRIASVSEAAKEITVTFTDNGPKPGEEVTVYLGVNLGTGTAQINAPLAITATGGTVSSGLRTDEYNASIAKGGWMFTLKDVPISDSFNSALTKRQDLIDQINRCQTMLDTGEITAPENGIVEAVYNVTNVPLGKDTAILSLASNEKLDMVVAVDELDVVRLKPGLEATVTVTALGGETYPGSVKKIASVGKIVGGIAMYDVTLEIENAPGMRIAMSGTARIEVGE